MKVNFKIISSEKMKEKAEKVIRYIVSISKKHKVDISLTILIDEDKLLNLHRVLVKPSFESKELMSKNYQSFHKEYLDKYVNDNNVDLMVMDIK